MDKLLTRYNESFIVRECSEPKGRTEREKRLLFLVDEVLELTTYCEEYSLKIGEIILDIMKYIHSKRDFLTLRPKYDYAREQWEFDYVVYVQFITQYLNWGTSIYSVWFDSSKEIEGMKLTSNNVIKLIQWLDGNNE